MAGMKKLLRITLWTAGSILAVLVILIVLAATVVPAPDVTPKAVPVAATTAPAPVSPTQDAAPATTQPAVQQPAAAPAITFAQQIAADVGSYANLITSAEETEPGRIAVGTSLIDPRGDGGSAPAKQAIGICQRIRNAHPNARYITVYEQDGTTFVLYVYGNPKYGNTCTEI